jgi:hypothetical protein
MAESANYKNNILIQSNGSVVGEITFRNSSVIPPEEGEQVPKHVAAKKKHL